MLELIVESILTNHNEITSLSKSINRCNNIFYISLITNGLLLYNFNKKIKIQDTQINEFKKELEEIKAKGE